MRGRKITTILLLNEGKRKGNCYDKVEAAGCLQSWEILEIWTILLTKLKVNYCKVWISSIYGAWSNISEQSSNLYHLNGNHFEDVLSKCTVVKPKLRSIDKGEAKLPKSAKSLLFTSKMVQKWAKIEFGTPQILIQLQTWKKENLLIYRLKRVQMACQHGLLRD